MKEKCRRAAAQWSAPSAGSAAAESSSCAVRDHGAGLHADVSPCKVPQTYSNASELSHHRLERLLVLLQQRVQLLVFVLERLVLQHQMRRESLKLGLELLCTVSWLIPLEIAHHH